MALRSYLHALQDALSSKESQVNERERERERLLVSDDLSADRQFSIHYFFLHLFVSVKMKMLGKKVCGFLQLVSVKFLVFAIK